MKSWQEIALAVVTAIAAIGLGWKVQGRGGGEEGTKGDVHVLPTGRQEPDPVRGEGGPVSLVVHGDQARPGPEPHDPGRQHHPKPKAGE